VNSPFDDGGLIVQLALDGSVYTLNAVKKAAYRFSDRFAVDIRVTPEQIICDLTFPPDLGERERVSTIGEFRKELLDQDLRESIGRETETMRNAILSIAFSPVSSRG
jgi:His-Xaa-Ser system protein HxsD